MEFEDQIRQHNKAQQNGVLSSFNDNQTQDVLVKAILGDINALTTEEDKLEKGRTVPIGTIAKRPNGMFIKTAEGWKYHSSHSAHEAASNTASAGQRVAQPATPAAPAASTSIQDQLTQYNQITSSRSSLSRDQMRIAMNEVAAAVRKLDVPNLLTLYKTSGGGTAATSLLAAEIRERASDKLHSDWSASRQGSEPGRVNTVDQAIAILNPTTTASAGQRSDGKVNPAALPESTDSTSIPNWAYKAQRAVEKYVIADKAARERQWDGNLKPKADEARSEMRKLLTFGDMKPFYANDKVIIWTGPGPLKISDDHDHESYLIKRKDNKVVIPNDKQIKEIKDGRKGVLEGVKSGKTVWWEPGGYVFSVTLRKNDDGSGSLSIGGRPNNAVGHKLLFEQKILKKIDMKSLAKEMEKFDSREKVRAYMIKQHDKPLTYDK